MTRLLSRATRLLVAAVFVLLLTGLANLDAAAQTDGTPIAEAPGSLVVSVFHCNDKAADATIDDAAPDCPQGGSASLWIDGAGPVKIKDGGSEPLSAGDHNVSTTATGPGRTVTITSGAPAAIIVTLHAAPPSTATAVAKSAPAAVTVTPVASVRVVVHQCQDKIKTLDALNALPDFSTQLGRCPAAPPPFDLSLTVGSQTLTLAGAKADGEGFIFENVAKAPISIVETAPPAGTVFGTAALDPVNNAANLQNDPAHATAALDLTTLDRVTLHIFNFASPASDRISIVTHVCATITAKADFTALPDFAHKLLMCPVTTLPANVGPSGLFHADPVAFDDTVKDSHGAVTTLAHANFKPEDLCETDIQQDLNGDGHVASNLCVDGSRYQFDGVAQGPGVVVTETTPPAGFVFGAVEIAPGAPGALGKVDPARQKVTIDTTAAGDLTIHVFNFAIPPKAPPEPQVGSLQVVALFCDGTTDQTVANALAPGAQATEADLGGAGCIAGDDSFAISQFGGAPGNAFDAGPTGTTTIPNLPATGASTGSHVVTELASGVSASFDIAPGQITRVIFLTYTNVAFGGATVVESGDPGTYIESGGGGSSGGSSGASASGSSSGGAAQVVKGADLPKTGMGASRNRDERLLLLIALWSGVAIVAGTRARRRVRTQLLLVRANRWWHGVRL